MIIIGILTTLGLTACSPTAPKDVASAHDVLAFVDPFIGTDGTGHTFPGATSPFGMIQLSPDTGNHSWDHTSGYQYQDTHIMGFSHNHLSGTGISDLGDVLLQPFAGEIKQDDYRSSFDKHTENAAPGFYKVTLTDNQIKVELTASQRVGMHRYTFTQGSEHHILVDLQHGIVNNWIPLDEHVIAADIQINSATQITGYIETTSWVQHKTFFVIEFDQPMSQHTRLAKRSVNEQASRHVISFDSLNNQQLQVKVALSGVSVDGALANLAAEVPDWSFDQVLKATQTMWSEYLTRVQITAPVEQKRIFYTGLYHLFIQPNNTADVDGRYRGYDDRIYLSDSGSHYSTFSLWDTFRTAHPLYTLLIPELVPDFVNSLLAQHDAQGFLPIWGLQNKETYTMIGNHAIPVVVDAVLKQIPGIDPQRAFNAVYETSTQVHKNSDWPLLNQYRYYPFDLLDKDGESVSRTLEHSVDEHAVSLLAAYLGKNDIHSEFAQRALYYRELFDPSTGFMRGKDSSGQWRTPFDPIEATSPMNNPGDYTEANAYQYSWAAQHAISDMIALHGGQTRFIQKLDEFFSVTNPDPDMHLGQEAMIGQYAHGNEPSHHIAYLYAMAGAKAQTNAMVTSIYTQFYDDTPSGIIGNEDCGQMSAWYIMSTMGFYPVNPHSGEYVLGQPQVSAMTITVPEQPTISIKGTNNALKASWNNQPLASVITHQQLREGGELRFE